jgi:PAS domain S-box-containing protein
MCERLGWTFEEMTSASFNPIEKIIPQRFQSQIRENIAKRLRGEGISPYEISIKARDGSEIPVIVKAQAILYGGKLADEVIHIDITERKQAEEELKKYHNHLEELVENRTHELLKSTEQLNQAKERLSNLSEQLRNLAAHLQSLREEERILISHEIHDELGHKLTGMKFDLMFLLNTMSGSEEEKQLVSEKIHSMFNLIEPTHKQSTALFYKVLQALYLK